ncbi:DUF4232 domain-containing protein [Streptomyces sp. NPDC057116]|uniref:DUF4232 domain-containing protein n=1 Tax=Streptomyces sp. NPDC057116 TaxID=3346023 RepID=UPI00363F5DAD
MRTFRTRTTTAAATALLAALSLTACQDNPSATPAPTSSAAKAAPTSDRATPDGTTPDQASSEATSGGTTGTPAGDGTSPGKPAATPTGGTRGEPGSGAPATEPCGADVKVTYTPVSRPLNHGLLTLTNTGAQPCDAYHAPLLRFDDAQATTPVNGASKPQAVVTVAPGESAYASITLAAADGSGSHGGTARTLEVRFAPRSGEGSTDTAPAVITLPADTYTDSSASVTHWLRSMDDALMH